MIQSISIGGQLESDISEVEEANVSWLVLFIFSSNNFAFHFSNRLTVTLGNTKRAPKARHDG